jgi:predicted nuclease of predicted toxin-antitoxin system
VDRSIWEFAKAENLVIVSKDSDFHERSVLLGGPPKAIWLRVGNCSTQYIASELRSASEGILAFGAQDEETCLIMRRLVRS